MAISKAVLIAAIICTPIKALAQDDPAARFAAQQGAAPASSAASRERNDKATLSSTPCSKLLIAYGSPQMPAQIDTLVEFVMRQGDGLGSAANILDFVATECRLNESITIGQAVKNLFNQERANSLPPIPIGGASNDPKVQESWKAFERWVHHQGPRPVLADSAAEDQQAIGRTPVEEKAIIDNAIKDKRDAMDALAILVKNSTYRCDSISAVSAWLFSRGFTLVCNHFSYEYDIADKGGHWIVTVK
jgi:hypothetical protein